MPRNGSGSAALPANSFNDAAPNTTIDPVDWNATAADIEAMLTASIASDGQTTTSAAIPFAQGIKADTIAENSSNTGVTIDSVLAKDGRIDTTQGSDIASATTTNLETATGNVVDVTGTTTITAITLSQGHQRWVRFTGALTLTNGASLVLPGAANITTVAGDYALFIGYASSVVRCAAYIRGASLPAGLGANTFTGIQRWAKGSDIASATALTLGTDGNYFDVTGTTTITSIGTAGVGTWVGLQFDGALTLTHHATDLILPGAANITTAAGDEAVFVEYASGDWRCVSYVRAAVAPLAYATQADQETATSLTAAVPPGRQQFHPSACKAWAKLTFAGSSDAAYNLSSVTDVATGIVGPNWDTDFSSANYALTVSPKIDATGATSGALTAMVDDTSFAGGGARVRAVRISDGASVDITQLMVSAFGDQ
jgi:hypothetical protein